MSISEYYLKYCNSLEATGNYRKLPETSLGGNKKLDFSTNDYLALSKNSELIAAAKVALNKQKVGSTGSRLLSGNCKIFEDLETLIAEAKQTETALVMNSGFQTNSSVLACLLDSQVLKSEVLVFFDRYNHASMYQGITLSGAKLVRYQHADFSQLQELLEKYKQDPRPKFIVSETLYGMDGDLINLDQLLELAKQYRTFLYLDEAHATGTIGKSGYGLSTTVDLSEIDHLVMGTFSKALGVCGAYVACSKEIKNYLINKCSGLIYSTAFSPLIAEIALKAWEILPNFESERINLLERASKLRAKLQKLDYDIGLSNTNIIPIIIGDQKKVIEVKAALLEKNIIVSAIRPPTVPPKTARLRIGLTIEHSEEDLEKLITALHEVC